MNSIVLVIQAPDPVVNHGGPSWGLSKKSTQSSSESIASLGSISKALKYPQVTLSLYMNIKPQSKKVFEKHEHSRKKRVRKIAEPIELW